MSIKHVKKIVLKLIPLSFVAVLMLNISCKSIAVNHIETEQDVSNILNQEIKKISKNDSLYVLNKFTDKYLLNEFKQYLLNVDDKPPKDYSDVVVSVVYDIKYDYYFHKSNLLDSLEVVNYVKQLEKKTDYTVKDLLTDKKINFINLEDFQKYSGKVSVGLIKRNKEIIIMNKPLFSLDKNHCLFLINNNLKVYAREKRNTWKLVKTFHIPKKEF